MPRTPEPAKKEPGACLSGLHSWSNNFERVQMPGFKPRFFRLLAGRYGPRVGTFKRMKIKQVKVKFALEQALKAQKGLEV